jgi:hypothetical protein
MDQINNRSIRKLSAKDLSPKAIAEKNVEDITNFTKGFVKIGRALKLLKDRKNSTVISSDQTMKLIMSSNK